jgi:hypothetical protein
MEHDVRRNSSSPLASALLSLPLEYGAGLRIEFETDLYTCGHVGVRLTDKNGKSC